MRRRPKHQRMVVGNFDVRVRRNKQIKGAGGEFDPQKVEIQHNCDNAVLKASTLLHELLHAFDLLGVNLNERQTLILEQELPRAIVENWHHFRPLFLKLTGGKALQ